MEDTLQIVPSQVQSEALSFDTFRDEVLQDYRWVCISREASLMGRKEVLTGKAKFGIFGDGKEVAQVAMAKFFEPGDFRAGYYRDQTVAFASGIATVEQFFAQLYADPNGAHDPFSAGRQMNAHFATPFFNEHGEPVDLVNRKNSSADMAPTAGQMPRALGLAFASKCFRNIKELKQFGELSNNGNEVCFCTIGDASTSEGHFWEVVNAAGVLQIPLVVFVWDDGYGISVPKKFQTTKGSVSEAMKGFEKGPDTNGWLVYKVYGWDYAGMCETFEEGIRAARQTHTPVLFHVDEITQPQGHSTSGSHERYKTAERLQWERSWDGLVKMREWIIANALASDEELEGLETAAKDTVRQARMKAWNAYLTPIKTQAAKVVTALNEAAGRHPEQAAALKKTATDLSFIREPLRRHIMQALHTASHLAPHGDLKKLYDSLLAENQTFYNTHLYNEGEASALHVEAAKLAYDKDAPTLNGYEILNRYFDKLFAANPKVVAFGEDLGFIGDVNQGFSGLQAKYGASRIFDTGIRELTIMGQGIGLAMRGLRPIAEIQYVDYLLYGLQPLSDEAATLHYRTAGIQSCPLIVRTRGHRLEGIWHSGSPMGLMLSALQGFWICVPRNMTQAVGMYNTLLKGADPAIVVESLNGYRLKEKLPSNLLEYTVALGVPDVLRKGDDITLVSYGSTLRIVLEAAQALAAEGINAEVIDVQTLLPFDRHQKIVESLKKTGRIAFIDEDVPGGATSFMFTQVIEKQGGYRWLDAAPRTLCAQPHRPAYGSDGDYFSKPNKEDIQTLVRQIMAE